MDIFRARNFKKNSRKGQAAIEFLMTYGWMLLIVLIVGALIFSFIDFGTLLPARVDLSGSFKGDASRIVASADADTLQLVIKYVGPGSVIVSANDDSVSFEGLGSNQCDFEKMTKSDGLEAESDDEVPFVNGQESVLTFDCGDILEGDTIEGDLKITYSDSRTPTLDLISSGTVRVGITQ